jgi:hypothetical protein
MRRRGWMWCCSMGTIKPCGRAAFKAVIYGFEDCDCGEFGGILGFEVGATFSEVCEGIGAGGAVY